MRPVEIAFESDQVSFDPQSPDPCKSRIEPDVQGRWAPLIPQKGAGGIDPSLRKQFFWRNRQVCRWETESSAPLVTLDDRPRNEEGVSQQGRGGTGFPQGDLLPDQGAADGFIADPQRGQDIHRPPASAPFLQESPAIPRPSPPESEIFPDNQSGDFVDLSDPVEELGGFHVGKRSREMERFQPGNPAVSGQPLPFLLGEEVSKNSSGKEGLRMGVERKDSPVGALWKGSRSCLFEEPGMSQVEPVEGSDRGDHLRSSRERTISGL